MTRENRPKVKCFFQCHFCSRTLVFSCLRLVSCKLHHNHDMRSGGQLNNVTDTQVYLYVFLLSLDCWWERLLREKAILKSCVKILDNEHSYYKRLTSKMLRIKRQIHGLNKQSNINFLFDVYIPVLNLLSSL
jgi:hypothetical protein